MKWTNSSRYPQGFALAGALLLLGGCAIFPGEPADSDNPAGSAAALPAKTTAPAAVRERVAPTRVFDAANNVFFAPAAVEPDRSAREVLSRHAARLKGKDDLVVTLVGHTDDLGSPSYNLAIAEQRVNAVYSILRSMGVPAIQIRRYGLGRDLGDMGCKSAECRNKMRRVELVYEP